MTSALKTLSTAFKFATALSLLGWLVIFGYPMWPQAGRGIVLAVVVVLLCAMYSHFVFAAKHLDEPGSLPTGSFFSLAGVVNLFKSPRVVLAGWIHYLAFDLMVGLYIVTDATRHGIAHLWLLPVLLLTLMFGPAGLLLYLLMRFLLAPAAMASGLG